MEFNKKTCNISSKKTKIEAASEQNVESEITLPEYFPDIVSVIKYSLVPNVNSSKVNAGKITVEGNSIIRILYVCEEKKLHCFEQRIPFLKTIEVADISNSSVIVDAKTEFINCRVVSQRKISIHAGISFKYKLFAKHMQQFVSECDSGNIQLNKCTMPATILRDCCVKYFNLNETMELSTAQESIAQIVRNEAVAILDSVKIVSGKILIKGELKSKILYIAENSFELEKAECTIPISQIIEADSGDDSIDYITLNVSGIDVFAKTDSSGALRMFDLTACIRAEINLYESINVDCICDAYSIENEMEQTKKVLEFENIVERYNESYLCKGTVDFGDVKIKKVLDIGCNFISSSCEVIDNEVKVYGVVNISTLVLKEDNELFVTDKEFDYEYIRPLSNCNETLKSRADVLLDTMNFVILDESRVEIRAELCINGIVLSLIEKEFVCDLNLLTDKQKVRKNAPLTIYFSEKGEKVWNIAKRYNTTVEAIVKENSLVDDEIKEKCKLLIPCR